MYVLVLLASELDLCDPDRWWIPRPRSLRLDAHLDGGMFLNITYAGCLSSRDLHQSNIQDIIYLDHSYLKSLPDPCAPWGELAPHKWV